MISIKVAQPKDVPRLTMLALEYARYEHSLSSDYPVPNKVQLAKALKKQMARRDCSYFLAEDAGALLGYAKAEYVSTEDKRVVGYIDSIFVRKIARKRNVGKLLVSSIFKWLRERKAVAVRTFVPAANKMALSYWEHQFFRISGFELEKSLQ
ncbi:GNAT family N-acetyltransferase [Candidatus Woesearchaeota archaeon]|nr:GNAT family N-acetyltransferase [Candidatus Woesearchaeota archaeon]